jgi:hypothetical protein
LLEVYHVTRTSLTKFVDEGITTVVVIVCARNESSDTRDRGHGGGNGSKEVNHVG